MVRKAEGARIRCILGWYRILWFHHADLDGVGNKQLWVQNHIACVGLGPRKHLLLHRGRACMADLWGFRLAGYTFVVNLFRQATIRSAARK